MSLTIVAPLTRELSEMCRRQSPTDGGLGRDWQKFDDWCHYCHLCGDRHDASISGMTNAPQLPSTGCLVFDGFDDLDTVGPLEVLSNAGFAPALVRPFGTSSTVDSAHGLRLTVDDQLTLD